MADEIKKYTDQILNATYGEEVRAAIFNALQELYNFVKDPDANIDVKIDNIEEKLSYAVTTRVADITQIVSTPEDKKDYNLYTTPGNYFNGAAASVSNTLHTPPGLTVAHRLHVIETTNPNRLLQIITSNTRGTRIYKRYGTYSNGEWSWYDWYQVADSYNIYELLNADSEAADNFVFSTIKNNEAETRRATSINTDAYYVLPESDFKRGRININTGEHTGSYGLHRISTPDIHTAETDIMIKPEPGYVLFYYLFDTNGVYDAWSEESDARAPMHGITLRKGQKYKISISVDTSIPGNQGNAEVSERYDKAHFFNPVQRACDRNDEKDLFFVLPASDFENGKINWTNGDSGSAGQIARGYSRWRISTPDIHTAKTDIMLRPEPGYVLFYYLFNDNGVLQEIYDEDDVKVVGDNDGSAYITLQKGQHYKISIALNNSRVVQNVNKLHDKVHFLDPVQQILDGSEDSSEDGGAKVDFGIIPKGLFYPGLDENYDAFPFKASEATPIVATAEAHADFEDYTTIGCFSVSDEASLYIDNGPSGFSGTPYYLCVMPNDDGSTIILRQYIVTTDFAKPQRMREKDSEDGWSVWKSGKAVMSMMYDTTPEQVYSRFHALSVANSDYMKEYVYTDAGEGNVGTWALGSPSDVMTTAYAYVLYPQQPQMSWTSTIFSRRIPTIFITSGLHGFEKASVFSLYYLFKHIIDNTIEHPVLRYLRRHCRIVCMPCVNPWGFLHKQYLNGPIGTDGTPRSSWGVNLNRNWDNANWIVFDPTDDRFKHNVGDPPVSVPDYNQYTGENPFSEWETRAARDLFNLYTEDMVFAIDYHTQGRTWTNIQQKYVNMNSIIFTPVGTKKASDLHDAGSHHISDVTSQFITQYNLNFDPSSPEWSTPFCGSMSRGNSHTVNSAKDWFDYNSILGSTFETFPSFKWTENTSQKSGQGYSSDVIRASEELVSNFIITVLNYISQEYRSYQKPSP